MSEHSVGASGDRPYEGDQPFEDSAIGNAEPWEQWETRLCMWSIGGGLLGLLILGFLIHSYIL